MRPPKVLNEIVDKVLAYRPKPKSRAARKRLRRTPPCLSCHKKGKPLKCDICSVDICALCARPHGAKSVCDRCLRQLDGGYD